MGCGGGGGGWGSQLSQFELTFASTSLRFNAGDVPHCNTEVCILPLCSVLSNFGLAMNV